MEHLSLDTIPLTVVPDRAGPGFLVRVDEVTGAVDLDPGAA
ncbi:hypothetical protein [Curtobacterium sp. 9128]|nr:hypothetical protein [Curtobacterium sp. 9128]